MEKMSSVETLMHEVETDVPEQYSYEEIVTFTSNFAEKIGYGGFSEVYRGQFRSGVKVAVKVLKISYIVQDMFNVEVMTLGTIYHRNLVKLYGFCFEGDNVALVYEFMENGSLDSVLYDRSGVLEWCQMYNIAVEIAKALADLHDSCHAQIIHHDVKPGNVLLDANFSAKLTDFGLANFIEGDETNTYIKGTPGYMAPEVCQPGSPVTSKRDVYGYGMLLFEILGRRRHSEGKIWFAEKVWDTLKSKRLDKFIGDCGIREEDRTKASILATVALWCVQFTAQARPSMSTVVAVLEKEMHVNVPPNPFVPSDLAISMQPDMNFQHEFPLADALLSDSLYLRLEAKRLDTEQSSKGIKQVSPLMPDQESKLGMGNGKKLQKFVAYLEKKRLITDEVCGSILAEMEKLQINCNILDEEKKLEESHTYLEIKRIVTNEVCESILSIMKEV